MQPAELTIHTVSTDPVSVERRVSGHRCAITRSRLHRPCVGGTEIVRLQIRLHAARLHRPCVKAGGGNFNQL